MPKQKSFVVPERLAGETARAYRTRLVELILKNSSTWLSYDDIGDQLRDISPTDRVSKESVVRILKVLEDRGVATWDSDHTDRRRVVWKAI